MHEPKDPTKTDWMKLVYDFCTAVEEHHIEVRGKEEWHGDLLKWNGTWAELGDETEISLNFTLPFDIRSSPWLLDA